MGRRFHYFCVVVATVGAAVVQPMIATGGQDAVLVAERLAPGVPCHQPGSTDDMFYDMDFSSLARVSARADASLREFDAYGGTYWHESGGVRVRIAGSRSDSAEAEWAARALVAELGPGVQGGMAVEATDVSNSDLRRWADAAREGLAGLNKDDVVSVSISELCQYVDVQTDVPAKARLSALESDRYVVSEPPVEEDHSRDTDVSPFYGGVRLWLDSGGSASAFCTAGFTMLRGGNRFLTTAGHCSEDDEGVQQPWYTTNYGNYVGTEWFNPYECNELPNDPCQRDSEVDVMLIGYSSYNSPIWFGGAHTTQSAPVTAKEPLPMLNSLVYISGGNSGLQRATVENRYDACVLRPAVRTQFLSGYNTVGGDSGSPVVAFNTDTTVQGDVVALGTHICRQATQGHEYYVRIDLVEGATDSSLVLSAG